VTHRTKTSPYQLAVIANDFQIPFHDERALLLFKMFLRRERPDWFILNGDFQDFWEISSYALTPRSGKDFKREIEAGKKILRSLRRSLPHARGACDALRSGLAGEGRLRRAPWGRRKPSRQCAVTSQRFWMRIFGASHWNQC
jgi:hypothetical protein